MRSFLYWPLAALFAFSLPALSVVKPELGKALPEITVGGEQGGNVKDNGPWSSASMRGKLHFVVYVDPDDSDLNDELINRLHEQSYPEDVLDSVALINLAASWKPNSIIMSVLRGKQEKFRKTTYVFDKNQYVAKSWGLVPEGYHVLLLDTDGTVLFEKAGKLEKNEIDKFLELVKVKAADSKKIASPKDEETKKSL